VIVLVGRPVRDRAPTATEWRLIEYDPTTRLPIGDVGGRWEPADFTGRAGRVNGRVLDWAARLLGHPVTVGRPADELAGPGSWHLHSDGTESHTAAGGLRARR
jgi:hypothetical protein